MKKHCNGYAANLCSALQRGAVPHEVFRPAILSWMKQANNLARFWITTRNIGAFEAIAMQAGQCEIVVLGSAAMLA